MVWIITLEKFAMHTCLRFLKATEHVCQAGAAMRTVSSCSARFLVSDGVACV